MARRWCHPRERRRHLHGYLHLDQRFTAPDQLPLTPGDGKNSANSNTVHDAGDQLHADHGRKDGHLHGHGRGCRHHSDCFRARGAASCNKLGRRLSRVAARRSPTSQFVTRGLTRSTTTTAATRITRRSRAARFDRLRQALSPRRWVRKPLIFGAVVALVVGVGRLRIPLLSPVWAAGRNGISGNVAPVRHCRASHGHRDQLVSTPGGHEW